MTVIVNRTLRGADTRLRIRLGDAPDNPAQVQAVSGKQQVDIASPELTDSSSDLA